MARKPATGTAVANWDEELAKQAELAAGMENSTASGQFFSLRGGILTFNDAPMPNNQMGVVILDGILENVFYEAEFDPENPAPPTCFAFGRDERELEPHANVVKRSDHQHDKCQGCPHNEWGSADKGRGKACRNTRRLALIPAGNFNDSTGKFMPFTDIEHFETAAMGFLKLPVTSVKGYAAFVKQVASALKRPPHAIFTKVKVVPDAKSQFKVLFEPLAQVPNDLIPALLKRHEEAKGVIDAAYPDPEEAPPPPPKKGSRAAAKGRGSKY